MSPGMECLVYITLCTIMLPQSLSEVQAITV